MSRFDDNYTYSYTNYGYEFSLTTYFSLMIIAICTLGLIAFEYYRRKTVNYIKEGYFFYEKVEFRRSRLIPVPPSNVDASDPTFPKIINPTLINQDMCGCY